MIPTVSTMQLWLLLASVVSAFHLYVGGNDVPSCFFTDLGKDSLLSEKHSAWELEESTQKWVRDDTLTIEITIDEVFDKGHRVYDQKAAPSGEFQFTTLDGGEHRICYRALTDGWWSKRKVKLEVDFVVGTGMEVVDSMGERKIGSIVDRVAELNRKFVHISREQSLMREREASFRDHSELVNSRVSNMTLLQLVVLAGTCAWQLSHLRSFFTKQKLV